MENEEKVVLEEVTSKEKKPVRTPKTDKNNKRTPNKNFNRREKDDRFEERVVTINRVSKTVKGGKRLRFAAVVVIGDGRGTVGFGTGKAAEVPDAIKKALESARKNLYKVPLVKGDTFKYEVLGRSGATRVFIKPARLGTGIVAGGPVRAVLELAGVKNIYSKVYGSRTPINIVRATINAIESVNLVNKSNKLRTAQLAENAAN